ncbi:hypothetical protein BaRGS_00026453, partial [Batillaria attramentaria]
GLVEAVVKYRFTPEHGRLSCLHPMSVLAIRGLKRSVHIGPDSSQVGFSDAMLKLPFSCNLPAMPLLSCKLQHWSEANLGSSMAALIESC